MKTFGLIGYPLGHSFSAKYFADKFRTEGVADCEYLNFAIENIEMLPELLLEYPTLVGFNVTIPYKEQVIKYLDDVDSQVQAIGAVNCVKIDNGRLIGHNTDAFGFGNSLLKLIGDHRPHALVLGTGGASKAVKYVLDELKIEYKTVSRIRTEDYWCYEDLSKDVIADYKLIINTTPLGTYPNTDSAPELAYDGLTDGHFLFDVVYNPSLTKFLREGELRGSNTMNGHQMLVDQAEKSWEIWHTTRHKL